MNIFKRFETLYKVPEIFNSASALLNIKTDTIDRRLNELERLTARVKNDVDQRNFDITILNRKIDNIENNLLVGFGNKVNNIQDKLDVHAKNTQSLKESVVELLTLLKSNIEQNLKNQNDKTTSKHNKKRDSIQKSRAKK